jgi:hypothetical protein
VSNPAEPVEPADETDDESSFERFEELAKALVKVPKREIDALVKKARKA